MAPRASGLVAHAPLDAWVVLWGALAFSHRLSFRSLVAVELWAGRRHLASAADFENGRMLCCRNQRAAFPVAGATVLAMIGFVTLVSAYPNRQHSAPFFQVTCATSPLVALSAWPFHEGHAETQPLHKQMRILTTSAYTLLAAAIYWSPAAWAQDNAPTRLEEVVVKGRSDSLIGVASSANEGVVVRSSLLFGRSCDRARSWRRCRG